MKKYINSRQVKMETSKQTNANGNEANKYDNSNNNRQIKAQKL